MLALLNVAKDTAKQQGHWKSDKMVEHYISDVVKFPERLIELQRFAKAGTYAYALEEDALRTGKE